MKETIPLTPNAGRNDGKGNDRTGNASGNASADSRSDSDESSARIDGDISQSLAGSGEIEYGGDELPLGDGGYKKRGRRSKKNISGSVSGDNLRIGRSIGSGRGRTDSDTDNGDAETEEQTPSRSRGIPREVAITSLGNSKEKKEKPQTNLSSEFIAEGFGLLFSGIALLVNDDEWKLPEEDASELADRTKKWARQGSKNIAAFEKKLARWEPMLMLIFGLFAVVLPRLLHTRDKRRNALRAQKAQASGPSSASNNNGSASDASFQTRNVVDVAGDASGRNARENRESNGADAVPFRRQDWRQIPGLDD